MKLEYSVEGKIKADKLTLTNHEGTICYNNGPERWYAVRVHQSTDIKLKTLLFFTWMGHVESTTDLEDHFVFTPSEKHD